MRLASAMLDEVTFTLKPLCALHAIVLTEGWKIFRSLSVFVLGEVGAVAEVGVDLVDVPCSPPCLLGRLVASYGRHSAKISCRIVATSLNKKLNWQLMCVR